MSGSFEKSWKKWQEEVESKNQRDYNFQTASGESVDRLYLPDHPDDDYMDKWGFPGQYPYTRGVHPNMYRGRLWTMRQFAGFGTPQETNQRFKFLLSQGQTGLSVAYDMPTLMGYDCDHELSDGEVGKCGVAVSSLKDMEDLFEGIPLEKVSVSQTINGPSVILLAFYIAVAQKQGVDISALRGTLQNDILKEYIAQKEWIFPPAESMRIITDMIEYCTEYLPKYNTISISGYHIREAGSTAVQELAFTLADGFTYVEHAIARGLDVDKFAPRLSFFFNSHLDFFEEIAKYRAARRIWSTTMKEKYGAKDPNSWKLRFHTQTAGFSLTAQQPENNIARTAFQAMAAVLGGTQSLHTNSMDETLALPSEKAVEIALRTQQLIAYETGAANVIDPLGGSWYIEELTDKIEEGARDYFRKIEDLGGVIPAIEQGYIQREIADSASEYQKLLDSKQRIMVGVNEFIKKDEKIEIPILEIGADVEEKQLAKTRALRKSRDNDKVKISLDKLSNACKGDQNVMPLLIDAANAYATLGEMVDAMKSVFGEWTETSVI
ncbi:MAG: methylmalonyl-CoA mutase family protein [Candidatus Marinimicrobia bacterium]|jgi:methylmalonyl-CoA mutase N-terminal domain/subunit|nr:methylmalonyl-CoA mutase family protein [Candidatus Neomarinimicrobiota bacterium]MBT3633351.1 methylmalonyl-CoA mutase family protein [Candidatus Neomarinimicrobiota bacterium]MBT3681494.1 methylmalonyl-CoA mutase family protein [Candidatus Neomarinimicrobiota bacterium]MBT3758539.1 methylmalonyl-CoA mutase family protein [Candidatus Neomarinimicrobiota bacterium]MBT3894807.1 methylmalonyl-CoA mutase family protein [Candidatus Neomarinimicrobiota bacterium]